MNKKLDRRKLFKYGVGGLVGSQIVQVGTSLLPRHGLMGKFKRALASGNPEAIAAATQVADHPVIQICLIDKIQQAMILKTPGTIGDGDLNGLGGDGLTYDGENISGQALPENAISFRGIEMTSLFGSRLQAGLADDYNLAFLPQFSSGAGGHSLQNTDIDMDKGGLNYLIEAEGKGSGMLGYVGFDIGADANDSRESATGPGRIPLPTYESIEQIRSTLKNSVAPLNAPDKFLEFRRSIDKLATTNDTVLDTLLTIKDSVDPVLPDLLSAGSAADVVKRQVEAIIALAKKGLASNFMIAIPWDDTNGGGNLSNPGGNFGIAPLTGIAMLADVYVRISKELPNAVTVVVSDGGRSANNGDAAGGMTIISGPSSLVRNGVFGNVTPVNLLGNANGAGQAGEDYKMSNSSTERVLEHKHVLSLVAKITHDIDTGIEYPLDISPKATS